MKNSPLIMLDSVSKTYLPKCVKSDSLRTRNCTTAVRALQSVTLSVNEGDYLAIVGASGSGKSTLMNVLGCLERPDSGKYYFCGKEVGKMNSHELDMLRGRKIGFVFQKFCLIPTMTTLENVALPLMYSGVSKSEREQRAAFALKSVGLGERMSHRPNELSGGQQQRTAIARALVTNPKVIFADEPTGNLDSKSGGIVTDMLKKLHRSGKTIVLITHDLSLAAMAERQITLSDGKIIN